MKSSNQQLKIKKPNQKEEIQEDDSKLTFKTKLARNIYRVMFETKIPKQSDLFLPHRMAYVVDLNDEETDVPITSIRSKAECLTSEVV
jgi:IK cytokine